MRKKEGLQGLHVIERSLKKRIEELTALYEVSRSITSSVNLDNMLELIVKKVARILKSDMCLIYVANHSAIDIKTTCGPTVDIANIQKSLPFDNSIIARVIRTKKPAMMNNILGHNNDMFFRTIKNRGIRSLLVVPLIKNERAIGALACYSKKKSSFNRIDEKELALFASQAAVAIENARLFEEIRMNYLNTMKLLASIIDAKDTYTENHSERVMKFALGIANVMKLSSHKKAIIQYASLLHDIGKIGIDISILRKPAPLTKEEWDQIREHPKVGADIIKKAGFLDDLVPAILYHHVMYAGGGYPSTNKRMEEIPIEARVLSVADAYEAMISDRPYRTHLSKEDALTELKRCSGKQFDPKVVKALFKSLKFQK